MASVAANEGRAGLEGRGGVSVVANEGRAIIAANDGRGRFAGVEVPAAAFAAVEVRGGKVGIGRAEGGGGVANAGSDAAPLLRANSFCRLASN